MLKDQPFALTKRFVVASRNTYSLLRASSGQRLQHALDRPVEERDQAGMKFALKRPKCYVS